MAKIDPESSQPSFHYSVSKQDKNARLIAYSQAQKWMNIVQPLCVKLCFDDESIVEFLRQSL